MNNELNGSAEELSEEELGGIVGGASCTWSASRSAGCGGDGVGGGAGLASTSIIFSTCNGDNCINSATFPSSSINSIPTLCGGSMGGAC